MKTRLLATLTASALAALAFAAPASAAGVFWADPNGTTGDACTENDPCRIDTAIGGAAGGDEVILKTGTYNINYTVAANASIDVRGEAGQPRPRLLGGTGSSATLDMSYGGTLTNVYVATSRNTSYAVSVEGVVMDRVIAEASGTANGAVELRPNPVGVVLRNSVARGLAGGTADAIQVKDNGKTGNVHIVGVTAVSGDNVGVVVKTSNATSDFKNTIFRGGGGDIEVKNGALAPAVTYTNYRPGNSSGAISAGAGNQAGAPAFVNEAGGNFEQAAGAPTIDAGAADALTGTVDVAGLSRTVDTIDIGAHEHQTAIGGGGGGGTPPTGGGGTGGGDTTSGGDATTTTGGGTTTTTGSTTGTTTGTTDGGAGTGSTGGDSPAPVLPPAGDPVLGLSVTLGEVKGRPLVRLPGTDTFVPLTADASVPVGATVDATKGAVELTSVRDASGRTQTGTFSGGVFTIRQSRHDTYTELVLAGGNFDSCKAKRGRSGKVVAAGRRHSATVRRLWGRDRGGRFRTRGRHGSATVRGTRWLTEDRCDGTLFKVAQGAIDVRDDSTRKTVRLKRGKSYLAGAAAAKPKKRR